MRVRVAIVILALMIAMFISDASASHCADIEKHYSPSMRKLATKNNVKSMIMLYWGSDPAYATSALFYVVLRHALGYQHVQLAKGPNRLERLIALQTLRPMAHQPPWKHYKQIALALSTVWDPKSTRSWQWTAHEELKSGLAGLRLEEFGLSSVPERYQLYVYLANDFQTQEKCINILRWFFHTDAAALIQCGFNATNNVTNHDRVNVMVYGLNSEQEKVIKALANHDESSRLRLQFAQLPTRKDLTRMFRTGSHSFFFVDYDMWSGYPNVNAVRLPPCIPDATSTCQQELDTGVPMRVGEVNILRTYAPRLLELAHNFTLSTESIREILLMESEKDKGDVTNVIEATCKWASKHYTILDTWVRVHNIPDYEVSIFHCADDPDFSEYDKFLKLVNQEVQQLTMPANFSITLNLYGANCSDANHLKAMMLEHVPLEVRDRYIGVVIGGVEGTPIAINAVEGFKLPVVLYNDNSINVDSTMSVWLTAGRSLHLALAINHFISSMSWLHVAVISEDTLFAKNFIDDLRDLADFKLQDYVVPLNLSPLGAENLLRQLQIARAHIILVNTNSEDAVTILSAAERIGITDPNNFAWIVREWRPNNITINITHFTISLSCRSGKDVPNAKGRLNLRKKMDELWPERMWPAQATAMADAVLSFVNGFKSAILKYPEIRDDTHNDNVIESLERSLIEEPVEGVIHYVRLTGHSLEEVAVFVDEWHDQQRIHLAQWRVNATARTVRVEHERRPAYYGRAPPNNAAWRCLAKPGDPYPLTCYDGIFAATLLILVLIPIAIALIRSARHCLIKKHKREKIMIQMSMQYKEKIRSALDAHLVNRSSLKLNQDVDVGRFSCVHFAVLRVQNQPPRPVVAKPFFIDQDESRILREACILASLDHDRIIRLVGVCIDNEPPLMLMQFAFFGDLLQYLRARRYLADGAASIVRQVNCDQCEEITHVSAEALTQFAHQAASALAYLSMRGVIHCDVRASNCLVDASRSLKLAGFGKAKASTDKESSTDNPSKKPSLITIQGLAPESMHGVFSVASDIWAFGVLVFELVTLGACPYGDMAPGYVQQFVTNGGNPQLPSDASPSTNELVKLCWRRKPEQRVTAAEVVTYLAEHPNGLQPALGLEKIRL